MRRCGASFIARSSSVGRGDREMCISGGCVEVGVCKVFPPCSPTPSQMMIIRVCVCVCVHQLACACAHCETSSCTRTTATTTRAPLVSCSAHTLLALPSPKTQQMSTNGAKRSGSWLYVHHSETPSGGNLFHARHLPAAVACREQAEQANEQAKQTNTLRLHAVALCYDPLHFLILILM